MRIINDILDFSKIEARKLDLEHIDFDLARLLRDLAWGQAARAEEKGIELLSTIEPGTPTLLHGDPGRLQQIISNLTSNAIKFTSCGEVEVRVACTEETLESVLLRCSVRDTGIGIAQEKQDLLFEKFSQVDASSTRKYGGTGLGLAISKQLVTLMGGEIGVLSAEGRGSEFWFTVRLRRQPVAPDAEVTSAAALQSVKALVIDDNAASRAILVEQMQSWAMRPSAAADGPVGLLELERALEQGDPFAVAVIDARMPGMDGEAVVRAIRAQPQFDRLPVVLLTSIREAKDQRGLEALGVSASAAKPVCSQILRHSLRDALIGVSGRPARRSAQAVPHSFAAAGARILLVEDNLTNQMVAVGMLENLQLVVEAVDTGEEALAALNSRTFDLVLMDLEMPGMDGVETTRHIRTLDAAGANSRIPVIAMTAHAMQSQRDRCLAAGMNDFISKPVSPQLLARTLELWLGGRAGASAPVATPADEAMPVVFDREGMTARLGNRENLVRRVVNSFLNDMPGQLIQLHRYVEAGDAQEAARTAHTIKGASGSVGGERLQARALAAEKAGSRGDLAGLRVHADALDDEFRSLREALSGLL